MNRHLLLISNHRFLRLLQTFLIQFKFIDDHEEGGGSYEVHDQGGEYSQPEAQQLGQTVSLGHGYEGGQMGHYQLVPVPVAQGYHQNGIQSEGYDQHQYQQAAYQGHGSR